MNRILIAVIILAFVTPAYGKTHKDEFSVPCSTLWPAVKDTVRNSGKYIVVSIDEAEMTASYSMGSVFTSKRINSVSLDSQSGSCEMRTQTAFSGLVNNDAADFKARVEKSLAKLQSASPTASTSSR